MFTSVVYVWVHSRRVRRNHYTLLSAGATVLIEGSQGNKNSTRKQGAINLGGAGECSFREAPGEEQIHFGPAWVAPIHLTSIHLAI